MLIRINATPTGPLSVIPRFPSANLAILEGYNGIGKTLATRILQVCTGTMPYGLDSAAWKSLREGLGGIEVKVTGLQGAESVVWVADSADWVAADGPVPRTDWFKSITVDGVPSTLDEVRRLIAVIRLAGDEDLTETFASQAETLADTVQRWAERYTNAEHGPLKQLEDMTGVADDLLSGARISEYSALVSRAEFAERDLIEKQDAVSRIEGRQRLINEVVGLGRRLSDLRDKAPGLQRAINEVDQEIRERQSELEHAQHEVMSLATQAGRTEALESELKNAEKTLKRNKGKLEDAWNRAATTAAKLEVEADAEVAQRLLEELRKEERRLVELQREQNKAPAMVDLLSALTGRLADAGSLGLDDQIAVDDQDNGLQLSVSQTRAGMMRRRGYFEQRPPSPEARELLRELEDVERRKADVETLQEILREAERFDRRVGDNQERVRRALQRGAGGEIGEALERATDRRFKCDQALRDLAVRRAALVQRLGPSASGATTEVLMQQFARGLEALGVPEVRLEAESMNVESQLQNAETALALATSTARDCQKEVTDGSVRIHETVSSVQNDERLTWLRDALLARRDLSGDVGALHGDLVAAAGLVNEVIERLGSHRNQLGAVERALRGIARHLRGQTPDAFEYVDRIQAWLATQFSNWFNDPRVRRELLKSADEGEAVTVDLGTQRVAWSEESRQRSRPLEAFSSGEQAFAYTRARLALLEDTVASAKNRLIVLDEFGAFISHHLLQGLLEYLKDWSSDRESDRVLLILPLSTDYSQLAETAVGVRAQQYRSFAKGVEEHGYITRTIVQ